MKGQMHTIYNFGHSRLATMVTCGDAGHDEAAVALTDDRDEPLSWRRRRRSHCCWRHRGRRPAACDGRGGRASARSGWLTRRVAGFLLPAQEAGAVLLRRQRRWREVIGSCNGTMRVQCMSVMWYSARQNHVVKCCASHETFYHVFL